MQPFVIAIDGPAASGKGTLAKKLASHYHLKHLDTGLLYRAVAMAMLEEKRSLGDETAALKVAEQLDIDGLNASILSSHAIGEAASQIAILPGLRFKLNALQKRYIEQSHGAVLDGRDIGTVVYPNAAVKLYVIADASARAQRRLQQILAKGGSADYQKILQEISARDLRDTKRAHGALKPAEDAHLLNTTKLDIEAAFNAACRIIDPIWLKRVKN